MKVKDILTEKTWIKNHYAVNNKGEPVRPESPDACKWCLSGAIAKVHGFGDPVMKILESVSKALGRSQKGHHALSVLIDFNDGASWADIDRVIRSLEL